ncbi:ricin-type beta-trefoil lectin domain protein [Lentzea aerocolonigenes]|uniref:ricin-type beta-trefoil lectin domain protein n=1 Tax=Lentzea aerocolonigenes TaxID=68170 RepID=UPI0012DD12F2|nr:ricin-type beta-trefoil lectin domain protein [Lentzea aerocolonigenes]
MRTLRRAVILTVGVALAVSGAVAPVNAAPRPALPVHQGEKVAKDKRGRVLLEVRGSRLKEAAAVLGGEVTVQRDDRAQIAVPENRVADLVKNKSVVDVRRPQRAVPMALSEGFDASGARQWVTAGKTGQDVKVGVIDVGFSRLDEAKGEGDIPADVQVNNTGCHDATKNEEHGTAVAEVVHDMAPGAKLFLACIDGPLDFGPATDWLRQQGVQVITAAIGFLTSGRGDGTGEPGSPADVVRQARQAGVLWSVAAGNLGQNHFSGNATDANGDGFVEFSGSAQNNGFTLGAGKTATIGLRWDAWPKSTEDLDLYVMKSAQAPTGPSDPQIIASSLNNQRDVVGGALPTEEVTFTNPTTSSQPYWIYLKNNTAKFTTRLDLFAAVPDNDHPLGFNTPAGSITEPATSPYVIAAGSTNPGTGVVPTYSGRGPTIDGRTKPDIIGFDKVTTTMYGQEGFYGTSAAAAHVAGAAALFKGAFPALDASQIQTELQARTNPHKNDNTWGSGVLAMGSPSNPPATTGSAYNPLQTSVQIQGRTYAANEVFTLPVPNITNDATAVVFNLAAKTDGSSEVESGMDVFPTDPASSTSKAATVRVRPGGGYVSTLVVAKIGPDRAIRLRAGAGPVNVQLDMLGYFSPTAGSTYVASPQPVRVLDTRGYNGSPRATKLGSGEVQLIKARGANGIPDNATAVVVNLTGSESTTGTGFGLYAQDNSGTSLNVGRNERRSNTAIVTIGADGNFRLRNGIGQVHAMVDILGWFVAGGGGARYVPLTEATRIADTATGTGGRTTPLGQGETTTFQVTGAAGIPANATSAVLMPSVQDDLLGTELSVAPAEIGTSPASAITTRQRERLSTTAFTPLGASGKVAVRNERGSSFVSLDAQGYFVGGAQVGGGDCAAPVNEPGYTSAFDGRLESNLAGWRTAGTNPVQANGCELMTNSSRDVTWYAARTMGMDYTVKLDWMVTSSTAESGVVVLFNDPGSVATAPVDRGVRVPISSLSTGAIEPGKKQDFDAAKPVGQWNTFEITVAFNTVTVVLNGQQVNRHTVTDLNRVHNDGFIGLQNSGSTPAVKFRNVRVKRNTATRNGEIVGVNNRCLDVPGYSTSAVQLQMWDCNDFPNQRWTMLGDGRITNLGRCLALENGGTAAGTAVTFQGCSAENLMLWVARPDGAIVSVRSGKCLTPANTNAGASLKIQDCTGAATQVWRIPDQHGQWGAFYGLAGKCLDIHNNDANNKKVQPWDCNAGAAQWWSIVGDGRIASSGRCLDQTNGAVSLQDCNGSRNQKWTARPDGTVLNEASNRCLTAASATNGAAYTVQDCTRTPLQLWRFSATALWIGVLEGIGGKCADVKGENPANGIIWLWTCFGPPGETYGGMPDGDLRTMGVCTDVGALTNGTAVGVANCHGGLSQQWSVRSDATIVNVESGRCMDVEAGNTADGTKIQLWDCVGTPQQRWSVPLSAS